MKIQIAKELADLIWQSQDESVLVLTHTESGKDYLEITDFCSAVKDALNDEGLSAITGRIVFLKLPTS